MSRHGERDGRGCAVSGIDVRVECVSDSFDVLTVEAASTARPGRCPDCRKQARRIHSTYQRALNERPLGSRQVVIRLRVRRYLCDRKSSSRKTFVEQVPGLSERHRRSSTWLTGWLRSIAIERRTSGRAVVPPPAAGRGPDPAARPVDGADGAGPCAAGAQGGRVRLPQGLYLRHRAR
ncbi:transposase family protein [Streptomyces sp. NPDC048751]|uniref:transposase family protein n=1 Tax=Streptomyces sp. NPDC048751 TaxID=3365591 RepID=UPI003714E4BE